MTEYVSIHAALNQRGEPNPNLKLTYGVYVSIHAALNQRGELFGLRIPPAMTASFQSTPR